MVTVPSKAVRVLEYIKHLKRIISERIILADSVRTACPIVDTLDSTLEAVINKNVMRLDIEDIFNAFLNRELPLWSSLTDEISMYNTLPIHELLYFSDIGKIIILKHIFDNFNMTGVFTRGWIFYVGSQLTDTVSKEWNGIIELSSGLGDTLYSVLYSYINDSFGMNLTSIYFKLHKFFYMSSILSDYILKQYATLRDISSNVSDSTSGTKLYSYVSDTLNSALTKILESSRYLGLSSSIIDSLGFIANCKTMNSLELDEDIKLKNVFPISDSFSGGLTFSKRP